MSPCLGPVQRERESLCGCVSGQLGCVLITKSVGSSTRGGLFLGGSVHPRQDGRLVVGREVEPLGFRPTVSLAGDESRQLLNGHGLSVQDVVHVPDGVLAGGGGGKLLALLDCFPVILIVLTG